MQKRLPPWIIGEFIGTFLLVFFGCGSLGASVLLGAQVGVFQVAIVWGLGIATAIFTTRSLSGAHLNPAVTCAFATFGDFPVRRVPSYVAAQLSGAFFAAIFLHIIFSGALVAYETSHHIIRGTAGSEASAMIFGEYFPNPAGQPLTPAARTTLPVSRAFVIELIGTAVLVFIIFAVSDPRNQSRPRETTPVVIGLTVTLLISLLGPLTMACFNPARDLAPRLWSALAGWGAIPFNTNGHGWLTVYVLAPLLGGQLGGFLYRTFLQHAYTKSAESQS